MGLFDKLFGRKPSRAKFAVVVQGSLRAFLGPEARFTYDPGEFTLRSEGGGRWHTVFLENMYRDYCNAPHGQRDDVLFGYLRAKVANLDVPQTLDEARDHLVPLVRHVSRWSMLALQLRAEGSTAKAPSPLLPVGDHLAATIAYDTPLNVLEAVQMDSTWNISRDELLDIAIGNLRKYSQESWTHNNGVYLSPWGDCYDGSRLLLADVIDRLEVRGNPVALHPTRSMLLITGSEDIEGLRMSAALAIESSKKDRPQSWIPLRRGSDGVWTNWYPENVDPRLGAFAEMRILELDNAYKAQRKLLQTVVGEKEFVAAFRINRSDGRVSSSCTWTKEAGPSLLPLTDKVHLCRGVGTAHRERAIVDSRRFFETLGHYVEKTSHRPVRYLTSGFPTAEEVKRAGGSFHSR